MATLYVIFFMSLGLLAFARIGGRFDRLFVNPILAFVLTVAFIYGFIPWLKELQQVQTYPFYYSTDAKLFALLFSLVFCLSGIVSGLTLMALSPLAGLFWIIGSLIGMVISVIFARIISEFVLIMFRINEHLGAIRQRGGQM